MTRVKRNYYLPGSRYSQNKTTIKGLFKEHGLIWKGTMEFPRWMSKDNVIVAEFIRENEVTVGANLKFEGDPLGPFCIALTKLMDGLGAEYDDVEVVEQQEIDAEIEKSIDDHMKHWDRVHRPNVELMRKGTIHNGWKPVPESFINSAMKDFKEKHDTELERITKELKDGKEPEPEKELKVTKEELKKPVKKEKVKQDRESMLDFLS